MLAPASQRRPIRAGTRIGAPGAGAAGGAVRLAGAGRCTPAVRRRARVAGRDLPGPAAIRRQSDDGPSEASNPAAERWSRPRAGPAPEGPRRARAPESWSRSRETQGRHGRPTPRARRVSTHRGAPHSVTILLDADRKAGSSRVAAGHFARIRLCLAQVASWRTELLAKALLERCVQQMSGEQGGGEGGR